MQFSLTVAKIIGIIIFSFMLVCNIRKAIYVKITMNIKIYEHVRFEYSSYNISVSKLLYNSKFLSDRPLIYFSESFGFNILLNSKETNKVWYKGCDIFEINKRRVRYLVKHCFFLLFIIIENDNERISILAYFF